MLGVLQARPGDGLLLQQAEPEGHLHGGLEAGPADLAVALQGVAVAEFLLHVQGDQAWWRSSYEPFDD